MINRKVVKMMNYEEKDENGNYKRMSDYWDAIKYGEIDEDGFDREGNHYNQNGDKDN